ncbi:holo-ACP synthase [Buchnera aphidicola]|uniref:Holo-[acyl-carrier-protein] synthase n=1 Tax=Buchnera aphidicola (Cinara strobi) TaxID=1921549 RepID=A0A3B1E7T9_9GAMM|nr:holo-ACP synthase [Buchnera aphidicola]VAX76487.1 Holo-[acyl-carrier-protein] synthase [Buchnera aphidicola (Cinara strobi)]
MSIIGIGIDIVNSHRFKKLILNYGFKIPKRILSIKELYEYKKISKKYIFLAKRFTAKEAAAKAMGVSIYQNMFLKNCEVIHNLKGKPSLKMFGPVYEKLNKLKIKKIFLSISDTEKYTQSIVVMEN